MSRANTPELVGNSVYVEKSYPKLFHSDKLWQIKTKTQQANLRWFSYAIKDDRVKQLISDGATGSSRSMRNISQSSFCSLLLATPPLPEQTAIANLLSTWDTAINKLQALIAAKEKRKKWLMQQLLMGKKRLPGFEGEWVTKRMSEIGRIPEKNPISKITDHKLITVKLHTKGLDFNESDKPKISSTGRPYYERRTGEILIGRQNIHNGGIGYVSANFNGHICSNAITSFLIDKTKNSIFFFLKCLQYDKYYKSFEDFMGGTGQKELSERAFLQLAIRVPPCKEEQISIGEVLKMAEQELELLYKKLQNLKSQKIGLMQVLLTGQIRLK
jgi:type I restriction enzyme S subunit